MSTYDAAAEIRKVDSDRATAWLGEGWRVFAATPGVWIAISVVLIVIHLLLAVIPGIGQVASAVLTPILTAGLMECCRIAIAGETLEFSQMFAGFKRNTGNLVVVGLLTLVAFALISVAAFAVMAIVGGASLLTAVQSGSFADINFAAAAGGIMLALLLWLLLALPVTMGIWFAPALVMFDNLKPIEAMKASFHAGMKNWLVLSLYGLVWLVLALIAAIPGFLGFILLVPVTAISIYISYREIFH